MMHPEAREILRKLVEELGSNVAENPQRWCGYLTDRLAKYPLERQSLTTALKHNVPEDLLSSQMSVAPQVQIDRLTDRLINPVGLQPEIARWAVTSWAIALGVLKPEEAVFKPVSKTVSRVVELQHSATQVLKHSAKRKWAMGLVALSAIGTLGAVSLPGLKPSLNIGQGGGGIAAIQPMNQLNQLTVGVYVPKIQQPGQSQPTAGNPTDQPPPSGNAPNPGQPAFNPRQGYEKLAEYLKTDLAKRFGRNIEVKFEFIEATGRDSFEQVRSKLKNQEWDMAFTFNPLLSAAAIQSNYDFAARMRPSSSEDFHVALVTRTDSPIKSLKDLDNNPDVTIALGNPDSPLFYVPVYDSYGRTLRVDPNNTTPVASGFKVLEGKADVGVVFAEWITDEPPKDAPERFRMLRQRLRSGLRLISASRGIPTAGVYLSPKISQSDRDQLRKSLLEAPEETRRAARYKEGSPGNYDELIKISQRVDEFLGCTDPTRWATGDRIQFTCSNALTGKINGYGSADENTDYLTLQLNDGKMHRVVVPKKVLADAGTADLSKIKRLAVTGVTPDAQTGELRITQASQIKPITNQ